MPDNAGVNKVFLLGEIMTDPKCYTIDSYRKEYRFSLMTTEKFEKRREIVQHQEIHHIRVVSSVLVEQLKLARGQVLHVEGKIHTVRVDNDDEIKRYKTEVIALNLVPVG